MSDLAETKPFLVNRCSVDSITLFEITEQELELLEQGSPSSTLLNFAIFSLSTGLAFLITLWTVKVDDQRTFVTFVVLAVLGLFSGIVLLVVWRKMSKSTASVVEKIKNRKKQVGPSYEDPSLVQQNPVLPVPAGPAESG